MELDEVPGRIMVPEESDYNAASGEFEDITGEPSEQADVIKETSAVLEPSSLRDGSMSEEGAGDNSDIDKAESCEEAYPPDQERDVESTGDDVEGEDAGFEGAEDEAETREASSGGTEDVNAVARQRSAEVGGSISGSVESEARSNAEIQDVKEAHSEGAAGGRSVTPPRTEQETELISNQPMTAIKAEESKQEPVQQYQMPREEQTASVLVQDASPSPPRHPGPRYQHPTEVLPKKPLQEYTNAASEHVHHVFSTASALHRGIRSLPDALSPDFRQKLYELILENGTRDPKSSNSRDPPPSSYTAALANPSKASGLKMVSRIHPYSGVFASYDYMPTEYDRQRIISKFEHLQNKLAQVTPNDFVVKAPPPAPKGAPAFSKFLYMSGSAVTDQVPAHLSQDILEQRSHNNTTSSGPFLAGGRIESGAILRGLADECMLAMCKQLSKDWPTSFLQVFEDSSGALVMCFDKLRAVGEGDLSTYMRNVVKLGKIAADYRLMKDGTQWGLLDVETQSVFFVVWPPWVRHRYVGIKEKMPEAAGSDDELGVSAA
ncbi:hypothetical protein CEUSTIGMA_g11393.t1 [Chlamydomonas eustigma]|uniref:Uncharacterized protein n=1 Tax=Chlamydomonas eustigma TaxID=1157962 RepID=A0A250XM13_9CHLO|nr:hypothetical protein CEUSTIGMA_g11393.t1 [Chlamydomonas eustigma]|eukprot:GAX83969.1 hypothetical protein CEUSTIGMA_g11393.t1 [Chlamydomonas eustigma]